MKHLMIACAVVLTTLNVSISLPCCDSSYGAPLTYFSECGQYGVYDCDDGNGRCGWERPNYCVADSSCPDQCLTLTTLVLVKRTSFCYFDEDEWSCGCQGNFIDTYEYLKTCDLSR